MINREIKSAAISFSCCTFTLCIFLLPHLLNVLCFLLHIIVSFHLPRRPRLCDNHGDIYNIVEKIVTVREYVDVNYQDVMLNDFKYGT